MVPDGDRPATFMPSLGIYLAESYTICNRRRENMIYGMEYLKQKLSRKQVRIRMRYSYYEMKHIAEDLRISTPPQLQSWVNTLGWCAKSVDSIADRLVFREFADDNFNINEIYAMNNPDVLVPSAVLGALISSCDFIYISNDQDGYPRLQVIDGMNATGTIDPITGMLTEGYAVLDRDRYGQPSLEAYFLPGKTTYYRAGVRGVQVYEYEAPYPLLVPIIYRPDAIRPFGHSRISRACMSIADSAMRTVKRSEISAEFYSIPQKYVLGTDQDAEPIDKWSAAMSMMLEITKDKDGDVPKVGQFSQQSMTPHIEQLRMFASLFAAETGLTLEDLGFSSGNPASSEAIQASHESLRLQARAAQRSFGSGFLNAGYLAACVRDKQAYRRNQVYLTTAKWEPIFEPDSAAMSGIGDAAIKLQQSFPDYFTEDKLRDLMGI